MKKKKRFTTQFLFVHLYSDDGVYKLLKKDIIVKHVGRYKKKY